MKRIRWALAVLALAIPFAASGAVTPGGSLDSTFGGDGVVVTDLGGSDFAADVLVQRDGKVIAIGEVAYSAQFRMDVAVARYNGDGTLDSSFSGDGLAMDLRSWLAVADAAALQTDGRLVVAGVRAELGEANQDFFLARYTAQGALDPTFGHDGMVTTDFGRTRDMAIAVLVQQDGKIVLAGDRFSGADGNGPSDFALARYDAAGKLDATFGSGGYVVTDLGASDIAGDAVLQADGKVVVVGSTGSGFPSEGPTKVALARYTPAGTLDPTFSGDGRVVADFSSGTTGAIALQADGKLVVLAEQTGHPFALARLTKGGDLDMSFGTKGIAVAGLPGPAVPVDIAVQTNGKIDAVGPALVSQAGWGGYALARFLPNGKLDTTFGVKGVTTAAVGADAWPGGVAVAADGNVIVAGGIGLNATHKGDFALARFLPGTCAVPNVRGTTLAVAQTRLAAGNCRLGTVRKVASKEVRKGRLISQTPGAGRQAPDWALVNVVISRGRK